MDPTRLLYWFSERTGAVLSAATIEKFDAALKKNVLLYRPQCHAVIQQRKSTPETYRRWLRMVSISTRPCWGFIHSWLGTRNLSVVYTRTASGRRRLGFSAILPAREGGAGIPSRSGWRTRASSSHRQPRWLAVVPERWEPIWRWYSSHRPSVPWSGWVQVALQLVKGTRNRLASSQAEITANMAISRQQRQKQGLAQMDQTLVKLQQAAVLQAQLKYVYPHPLSHSTALFPCNPIELSCGRPPRRNTSSSMSTTPTPRVSAAMISPPLLPSRIF